MTYEEFINNILETRGRFACGKKYHERHHIVPKCMGGSNDKENLIDLFAREHFEAHRLLALENPKNEKLVYAWWMMAHGTKREYQDRCGVTAEEYEEAKKYLCGIPKSKETKIKMSLAQIGEKNHRYGKHLTDEEKEHLRKLMIGENNPFFGKKHTEESKEKISTANTNPSEETRKKMSKSAKERCTEDWRQWASEKAKKQCKGKNNPNAKVVIQYDLNNNVIKIWDYVKQAAEQLSINKTCIAACCRGRQKTAGGFIWRYADEIEEENLKGEK